MTDAVTAVENQVEGAEDKEAILNYAASISEIAIEQELSFNVVFNGITTALVALLLDYSNSPEGIQVQVVQQARDFFVNGLDNALNHALTKLAEIAQAQQASQVEDAQNVVETIN